MCFLKTKKKIKTLKTDKILIWTPGIESFPHRYNVHKKNTKITDWISSRLNVNSIENHWSLTGTTTPPRVLPLTPRAETPHRRRWREPPRLNETTPSHTHSHNHRRAITHFKAPNWPAWLRVNANWARGQQLLLQELLSKVRRKARGRERVCVCMFACVE